MSFYGPDFGRELTRKLPAICGRVAANLGCKAAGPYTIRVLRTRKEFIAATGNKFGDGYSSGNCLWTYHGAPGILDNVIPHELAHAILRQAVGNTPRWLNEGLAVRQEAAAGAYWRIIRETTPMPITRLLDDKFRPAGKDDNNRFYASAYSFVDMLIRDGGISKIHRLIGALKAASPEKAFKEVYGLRSLREVESKWLTYLQD